MSRESNGALPAVFYLYDVAALWRRIGTLFTGVSFLLFFAGFSMIHKPDEAPTLAGILFVLLVLVVAATDVLIALNVRQGAEDGLRLDSAGVALVSNGREIFWPWRNMADIRLHSRFHPARLIVGRSIGFQVDGVNPLPKWRAILGRILFPGQAAFIGGNYFVRPEDLLDRMTTYRKAALGKSRKQTHEASEALAAPIPAFFAEKTALTVRSRFRKILIALPVLIGAGLLVAGAVLLADRTWPEALEALLESGLGIYMALPLLLMPALGIPFVLWSSSPVSNMLLLGPGGIFVLKGPSRKHWSWDEIREIKLREYVKQFPTNRTDRTVGLTVEHEGQKPKKPPKDDRPSPAILHSLDDIYDAPLEEIAAALQAWGDWHGVPRPGRLDAPRWAIRIHHRPNQPSDAFKHLAVAFPLLSLLIFATLFVITWRLAGDTLPEFIGAVMIIGSQLLIIAPGLTVAFTICHKSNYLELDAEGLTWRRLGRERRWRWLELPSFEYRIVKLRWSRKPTAILLFAGHRDDRLSRLLRWAYRIDVALPRIVIEDIYDSPIQDILLKLREYRQPPRYVRVLPRWHGW